MSASSRRSGLVAILHGAIPPDAPPDEQDTLVQVAEVADALRRLGHRVAFLPVGLDLSRLLKLRAMAPAVVFNLVEAVGGEGRLLHLPAAVLDTLGLAYTGAPSAALHATTDKLLAKRLMTGAGLPTPDLWQPGTSGRFIVKPVHEDASIGIDAASVVPAAEVPGLIEARRQCFGGDWFAERFVAGREFNLALLEGTNEPELLPIAEIEFTDFPAGQPQIVGYAAKWDTGSVEYRTTPRTFLPRPGDEPLRARLAELALAAWHLFGLRGYARVDLRVDAAGRPWILEVNANPCLSRDAGFAAAGAQAGLDQTELVRRIVAAALRHTRAVVSQAVRAAS